LSEDGSVKLTDFGLARSLHLPEITLDGTLLGTPAYSAPEQIKGAGVDAGADIFSLGVVAYEILTGLNPFAAPSYSAIIDRICHAKPKPAYRSNPSVPQGFARIVQRMIAKRPTNRYQNLGQFLKDLDELTTSEGFVTSTPDLAAYLKAPSATRPISPPRRRVRTWLYPALAGMASAVILLLLMLTPHHQRLETLPQTAVQPEITKVKAADTHATVESAVLSKPVKSEDKSAPQTESFLRFQIKPWARVYVDGEYWETTPTDRLLSVKSGKHEITMENDHLPAYEKVVNVEAGETLLVKVDLLANTSWLAISVRPWGKVYIDGNYVSTTPISEPITMRSGRHRLLIIHPSLRSHEALIEIEAGDTLSKVVVLN